MPPLGPQEILNKPQPSDLPVALASSTNRIIVQETAGRRDITLNFTSRPGGDYDYGDIYGSIASSSNLTNSYITSNIGGIRYSGTSFQLDCYVLDVSTGAVGNWNTVWFNGAALTIAQNFGLTTVPWSTSTTRWRHFRTIAVPSGESPGLLRPRAFNMQDTTDDVGDQYFRWQSLRSRGTTEPLNQRFEVITQADYDALAVKVVDRIYFVTP